MPSVIPPLSEEIPFDPKLHLQYSPPARKITMKELGLVPTETSTPVAGSVPFPLLSHEGVVAYRKSLFSKNILENCAHSPLPGTLVLRNAAKYSRFIHEFWAHTETTRVISEALGVQLSAVMPIELGHTNIQVQGDAVEEMVKGLHVEPVAQQVDVLNPEDEGSPTENSVIPWHFDSYPYVCVLMLSNTQGMIGGETYIKKGDGTAEKIEGPMIGHAVVLQGGEIQHLAARAKGVDERITTITSYRATVPGLYDSSYIANVRPVSHLHELYEEWAQYRLEKMKQEIERMQREICKKGINVGQFEEFADSQIKYLERSTSQMIPIDFHNDVIAKYGKVNYYNVAKIWEKVQKRPDFLEIVTGERSNSWKPDCRQWISKEETAIRIKRGEMIESSEGRFKWSEERPWAIGDELLAGGLRESLLDWLDYTGLYDFARGE